MNHRRITLVSTATGLATAGLITGIVLLAPNAVAGQATPAVQTAALSAIAPASTSTAAHAAVPAVKGEPLVTRACRRLAADARRGDRQVTRLSAGATTKNSIAWVQAEAAAAQKAGHPARAKRLTVRVGHMNSELGTLKNITAGVQSVAKANCPA